MLAADRAVQMPIYRLKQWQVSARRLDKQKKKKNWLGNYWKSCIFVPPTPGSVLKKEMQKREEELRAGGRESWPIKIIETAGKTLEQTLVNTDPFSGNTCYDKKCLINSNSNTKISCRRNGVCYRVTCLLCCQAGKTGDDSTRYFGESGKNMHCRLKEHVFKFSSKIRHVQADSAFIKHLESKHEGKSEDKTFSDYFKDDILKAYRKPFTRCAEEETFIASHEGVSGIKPRSSELPPKLCRAVLRWAGGREEGSRVEDSRVEEDKLVLSWSPGCREVLMWAGSREEGSRVEDNRVEEDKLVQSWSPGCREGGQEEPEPAAPGASRQFFFF